MAIRVVLPGQPLHLASDKTLGAALNPSRGAFGREGAIYSSCIGNVQKDGGSIGVQGKEDSAKMPDTGDIVSDGADDAGSANLNFYAAGSWNGDEID